MKRQVLCAIPALALALLIVAGCGGGGDAKKEALIGANLEMSGESAEWGADSKRGIEMAFDEINAKPEQKIKLRAVFEDNKSEAGASKNAMKKLVTQDNVIAVIGAVGSARTIAASDVAMEEKVPLMTHASTNVTITKKGEFISRICFDDNFQGAVMARFARRSLKAANVVIVAANGNPYSEGLCASFKKVFTEDGGVVLDELAYQKGATDFKTLVTQIKAKNPAIIWVPGYHNEVALIIKQAREGGLQAPFLGADGWDNPELFTLCGPSIKGNFLANHFDPGDPNPKVQDFVKKFKERFKLEPTAMGALAYDAAYAMADSVNRAKELTPLAMKEAINSLKGVVGVCGTITLSPEREVVKEAVVLETDTTRFKYKETIKP
ncbi:MAG: ABC transporter substrate-binding protein [Planctomycetota bacterium]